MKNTLILLLVGNKILTPELIQEMIQDQEVRYLIIKNQNGPLSTQILHWLNIFQAPNSTMLIRILPYHPNQTKLSDIKKRLFPEFIPNSMLT